MKLNLKPFVLLMSLVILTACSEDDNITPIPSSLTSKTYSISSIYDNNVDGSAKFIKNDDDSVTVELSLTGIPTGNPHPATINYNTAAEGGSVAVTLETVNGNTGFSTTTFSNLDDGTTIPYKGLWNFNGFLIVQLRNSNQIKIIAKGVIDQNFLIEFIKEYR